MTFLSYKFWLIAVFVILIFNGYAQAQTVSLTSGGFVNVGGEIPGTPLSNQTPAGQTITANLNFGDAGATVTGRKIKITMPIRISATGNYKIELQRAANNGSFEPKDIGFGVGNIRPQTGGAKLTPNGLNVSIAGNFGANPVSALIINGVPQYSATLANISDSSTVVLTGVPTVASGSLGEDDNSILVDLTFVIVPQYFTPGQSNLSLAITIKPLP